MSDKPIHRPGLAGHAEPPTPASQAPTLVDVIHRVHRRRRRKSLGWICTTALIGVAGWSVAQQRPMPTPTIAGATIDLATIDVEATGGVAHELPSAVAPLEPEQSSGGGVRAFARVMRQVPVFGLQPDTRNLHHVGWIDSQAWIPVDLSQIPQDQQESIQAVLDQTGDHSPYSL